MSTLSRVLPLRSLSVAGAILVGASQVICFLLGSLATMVPVIGLLCGLGSALSTVVDEMALHLHFEKQRHKALALYAAAFSLSAIVYPPLFLTLVETYGLNGALLVSGALSLNGLAGSVVITRPVWLPPDIPLPPLYRRASDIVAQVESPPPAPPLRKDAKGDAAGISKDALAGGMPDSSKVPDPAGEHGDPASRALAGVPSGATSGATSVATSGATSGVTSGATSGIVSVDGIASPPSAVRVAALFRPALRGAASGMATPGVTEAGDTCGKSSVAMVALAERQGATIGDPVRSKEAAPTATAAGTDNSIGIVLVFYCALTSLSVTAGAVVYDYAMAGDRRRSLSAIVALVSLGVGDLLGRVGYEILLATGEHRKVMAVQAFLQGGVLFLMALAEEIFLLVPVSFALGWLSSTLDMLPVPVLQRFVEPDIVDKQLGLCRGASGVACLLGPVLVMVFRDSGSMSYSTVFVVSGFMSLLAGALWLPGLKKELDEARAKAAAAVASPPPRGIDVSTLAPAFGPAARTQGSSRVSNVTYGYILADSVKVRSGTFQKSPLHVCSSSHGLLSAAMKINAVVSGEVAVDHPEPEVHEPDAEHAGDAEHHAHEAGLALSDEAEAKVPPPGSQPGGARPGGL
ncbi:uncharacterized protein [Dermacentor andersoni]|uniref:uncharacterized protein n=1 Tax=Dermacentor andersoni TaxID=34620 RepID=UPI002415B8E8|nr:uncharacterized protein LOC129381626 [Dermacentor andersoni]